MNENQSGAVATRQAGAGEVAQRGQAITTVASLLKQENVTSRINALLGDRAPQFTSSLLSLTNASRQLSECEPKSVLASAMIAATLDLPINPNLGFAYIIPYGRVAQFQMGYKGFIQLAMRTGQYSRMNAVCVNAEALPSIDDVGEPVLKWDAIDETKPAVGYAFAFKLSNGFTKVTYWSKKKVEAHATRYSQAFRAKKQDSPWFNNFDSMAIKTVIKNTLAKWGILSVSMERAITEDQGTRREIEDSGTPLYLDAPIDAESSEVRDEADAAAAQSLKDRVTTPQAPAAPPAPAGQGTATTPPEAPKDKPAPAGEADTLNDEIKALWEALPARKVNTAAKAAGINISEGEEWEMASIEKRTALLSLLRAAK